MQSLINLLGVNGFIPHGYCLTWSSALLWLHVISDALIVLSYYSIPLTLAYFVRKRKDLPYPWLFAMFGLFIVACGTTHLLSIITVWIPLYWLDGVIKALTAAVSVTAALMMFWVVPRALTLRGPAELETEVQERKQAQAASQEALERLNKIASQAPGVMFQFRLRPDGSFCVPYASAGIREIFRVSPEEVREDASKVYAHFHPEDIANHLASIQVSAQDLSPWSQEYRLKFDDESVRWLSGQAIPQKDEDGSVLWHGFITDITGRKQAEELIRVNQARFSTIFNQAPLGIALIDSYTGKFHEVNPRFAEIAGRTLDEMTQTDWMSISHPDDVQQDLDNMALLNAGKIPGFSMDKRYLRTDGSIVWINLTVAPLKGEQNVTPRHLAMIDDITERKEHEEELKRSNIELEQFSYAVSHDMRQPLRMIASYLQLLEISLAGHLDDEKRNYFGFAVEGAKRIDRMLVELLEYSRVGKMGEPPTWTDSRAVLGEALQFLQPAIDEADARVSIAGDWPRILASHDEVQRLMQNLIDNAVKYRVAGRTPEITITGEVVKNEWRLCVTDNGVGIIPGQIKQLFQVFRRLQSRLAYEGTGIGLAMCRKIAEHHKGRIWAESDGEWLGSRFCVVLPVSQPKTAIGGNL